MDNDSRIAGKIKTQITRFANKISHGFKKPTKKFLVQMVYGIQASKDVKLSMRKGAKGVRSALDSWSLRNRFLDSSSSCSIPSNQPFDSQRSGSPSCSRDV